MLKFMVDFLVITELQQQMSFVIARCQHVIRIGANCALKNVEILFLLQLNVF